jgi:hypothetical protein
LYFITFERIKNIIKKNYLVLLGLGETKTKLLGSNTLLTLSKSKTSGTELLVTLDSLLLLLGEGGISTDGLVGVLVDLLELVSSDALLLVAAELTVISLRILLKKLLHVVSDVTTEDVLAKNLSVELLLLIAPANEATLAVRDVETTIKSTLHSSEHTAASGGTVETDIEKGLEGTTLVELLDGAEGSTSSLLNTRIELIHAELLVKTTSNKKTSGVGSSVVGETKLDAIARKLVRVSGSHDVITIDAREDDLADDITVGETNDKTVLGGVVLVLVLNHKTKTLIVISLTLTTTTVLSLETLEISLVLDNLLERHF